MPSSPVISVRDLSKKFRLFASPKDRFREALHPFRRRYHREFWALRDVSFDVLRGQAVGIMGRNGSGKSTLLQIVSSVMRATQGEVCVNGRLSALLELGAGFNPEFTGRDNVILNGAIMGLSRKEMIERLPEIETFADIGEFFDQPVRVYSSGMYARVAFACAIHVDPDVLILDEILGVGDAKFQEKCYNRICTMRKKGVSILLVSHSTEAIQRNCESALLLEAGKVVQYGPVDAVVAAYHDLLYGSGKTGLLGDAKPFKKNEGATLETENIAQESELRTFLEGDGEPLFRRFPYYNPYERRIGNGGAEIVDFLVAANGELHFNVLSGSETLTVYLKVRFNRRVDMPRIGWAIVTSEGIVIAGSNTVMLNIPLASAQAGETWVYAVKMKPNFCGGQYFLTAGVGECDKVGACDGDEWTYFDVRRSVCHLSVATSGRATGFVEVPFSCAVLHGPLNKALSLS